MHCFYGHAEPVVKLCRLGKTMCEGDCSQCQFYYVSLYRVICSAGKEFYHSEWRGY